VWCPRMPRGPRGEKRPADVIGNAVKVMRITTGEEPEDLPDSAKSAAAELGARGGKARAAKMTAERRVEIARKAAAKRWGRHKTALCAPHIDWHPLHIGGAPR